MDTKLISEALSELASEATLCEKRGDLERAKILWAAHERVEAEFIREQTRTTGTDAGAWRTTGVYSSAADFGKTRAA